ncbi:MULTISPECIES: M14 family zinc carboxypeptidase [Leptospira]|uniref:Zinc carboxypeptidase n=1 Tax=Leptospira weilii str. UI 13098 TaxID=1088542 RepID=M6Q069_9LEPT|nr:MULTISPECIES: M14 family zinc carboxypeptidase [Leptospira]EMJ61386.1 zinc carboxypeptidase [Leptospira sp. P2653]EMN88709.1 zinc carboxypeptidase [Leptospira weilii str. UI 13098]MDL5245913.1 M14 family zinc carboxypeptidase [Leptospira weilii]OMI17090.1 carboxypeptidase [Leptospira weilii serovar Heyan]UPY79400.1 carboxypeptidase [Leptospira weilii]
MLRGLKRLNRYDKKILKILKLGGKLASLSQIGFSRKTSEGFRFPIHALKIGTEKGIKEHPVGIMAGVHGLETIGILILLDFLEYVLHPNSTGYIPELEKGKLGIVVLPIVNPGGVVLKQRSNPAGVDLMRNSGIAAIKPFLFFGGQKISKHLPYFRGNGLEPESKALFRLVYESFFTVKDAIIPVLDLHSGFGTVDNVWWPYAFTKAPCPDTSSYQKIEKHLKHHCGHIHFQYGPQSETYTTHGDLWDKLYDQYRDYHKNSRNWNSKLLPLTLEVGTWSDIKEDPFKLFRKRGIFNPASFNKIETVGRYRGFLRDFVRLGLTKPKDWERDFVYRKKAD